jgi:hypothetical protein
MRVGKIYLRRENAGRFLVFFLYQGGLTKSLQREFARLCAKPELAGLSGDGFENRKEFLNFC